MSATPLAAPNAPVLTVAVTGIGLLGPGLADWAQGATRLADPASWAAAPTAVPAPQRLPATERRRAGLVVKAGIVVADQALAQAGLSPAGLATVFTSSTGDPANCHQLCEALAQPERLVSPTKFTNSVHNAPAGYWHIATASMAPSTSLAAFDASFAEGLLEAAVQVAATQAPVLLVAVDVPYPEPLHGVRPLPDTLALALLLQPVGAATGPSRTLTVALARGVGSGQAEAATPCGHAGLDALRAGIPAARGLPLLQALAGEAAADLRIEGLSGEGLAVQVAAGAPLRPVTVEASA